MQPGRPYNDMRMRIACWITKATDTHSECVILPQSYVTFYLHYLSCLYCVLHINVVG